MKAEKINWNWNKKYTQYMSKNANEKNPKTKKKSKKYPQIHI